MSLRKRRYTATKPKKRSSNIHELTKWVGDVRKWQKVEKTVGKMQLMKWELGRFVIL